MFGFGKNKTKSSKKNKNKGDLEFKIRVITNTVNALAIANGYLKTINIKNADESTKLDLKFTKECIKDRYEIFVNYFNAEFPDLELDESILSEYIDGMEPVDIYTFVARAIKICMRPFEKNLEDENGDISELDWKTSRELPSLQIIKNNVDLWKSKLTNEQKSNGKYVDFDEKAKKDESPYTWKIDI